MTRKVQFLFPAYTAVIFGLLWTLNANAQYTTGQAQGIVKDQSGALVAAANVTLTNVDTNVQRAYTTGTDGSYFFVGVPSGNYQISATAKGFTKVSVPVVVYANQTLARDISLSVAGSTEVVQVSEEAGSLPVLDVTDAQAGTIRSSVEINDLPSDGRTFFNFISLEPGVNPTFAPGFTSLSITSGSQAGAVVTNGGRARATAYQLDYTDANDWEFGGLAQGRDIMPDAIQELTVLTSNFSAEYGVKSSGQVIVGTKSGTNSIHGAAGDFVQNDIFNARDYFDTTGKATVIRNNNYSVTAGGPIVKNRAFIFGGYQALKVRGSGFTSVALVPTDSARARATDPIVIDLIKKFLPEPKGSTSNPDVGTFSSVFSGPTDTWQFVTKFDYKFSDSHFLSARYLQSHNHFLLIFPALNTLPGFDTDFVSEGNDANISDTYLFSPQTTNQFRLSYGRAPTSIVSQNGLVSPRFNIEGLVGFGALQFFPNSRLFNVFQVNDVVTHLQGRHTFKTGFDVRKIQDNTFLATNSFGFFDFPSLDAFLAGQPGFWTNFSDQEADVFGRVFTGFSSRMIGK